MRVIGGRGRRLMGFRQARKGVEGLEERGNEQDCIGSRNPYSGIRQVSGAILEHQ